MIECVGYRVIVLYVGKDRVGVMGILRKHQKWLQLGEVRDLVNSVPCCVARYQSWQERDALAMAGDLRASGVSVVVISDYGDVPPTPPGSFTVGI